MDIVRDLFAIPQFLQRIDTFVSGREEGLRAGRDRRISLIGFVKTVISGDD